MGKNESLNSVKPREKRPGKELEIYGATGNFEDVLKNLRSMSYLEILDFLKEHNIKPLPLKSWLPRTSIIVVFEDSLRKDKAVFQGFKPEDRPSFARVDCPISIVPGIEGVYNLENGGQIDYYAISPKDKQIRCVKSSKNLTKYFVSEKNVFSIADDLFPKM